MDNASEAAAIGTAVSYELRTAYVIGYASDDSKMDRKWRKVKVKLQPPPGLPQLTVHARSGYYAPLQ
jgi:Ca-activated chloride channel family protein